MEVVNTRNLSIIYSGYVITKSVDNLRAYKYGKSLREILEKIVVIGSKNLEALLCL